MDEHSKIANSLDEKQGINYMYKNKISFFSDQNSLKQEAVKVGDDLQQQWKDYLEKSKNQDGPRSILKKAVDCMSFSSDKKIAIDIGCGSSGRNTLYLLSKGYRVLAVDQLQAIKMMREKDILESYQDKLVTLATDISDIFYEFHPANIISCTYVLPFIPPEKYQRIFDLLKASLKPGGYLAIDFFGLDDDWAKDSEKKGKMTFHTSESINDMFSLDEFKFIHHHEKHKNGNTAEGQQKNWHVFHILLQKNFIPEQKNSLCRVSMPQC